MQCQEKQKSWHSSSFTSSSSVLLNKYFNFIRQRKAKAEFELTKEERDTLNELVKILELFEWVKDEFQSNRVSISRVYPCISALRAKLNSFEGILIYTEDFCTALLKSLEIRFGKLSKNEVYVVATFLDPNFGLDSFPNEDKPVVLKKVHSLLLAAQSIIENPNGKIDKVKVSKNQAIRNLNYVFFREAANDLETNENNDKVSNLIEKYLKILGTIIKEVDTDTLDWWRTHEVVFPGLALLARKYLSVQASSASVERMFSIAGHIFSVKRRRLGIRFFTLLLILKLNEDLID